MGEPGWELHAAQLRAERAVRERDRYIRLFNRLDAAISHHQKDHLPAGRYFADLPDVSLWAARDRILRDAGQGGG